MSDVPRKPKSERRQRHALVSVRFTAAELAAVQASAAKSGATVSGFIRDLALRAAPSAATPAKGNRTPGTPDECEWERCRQPGTGELRGHYRDWTAAGGEKIPWTMCAEHVKPERHPEDLRGRLVEW